MPLLLQDPDRVPLWDLWMPFHRCQVSVPHSFARLRTSPADSVSVSVTRHLSLPGRRGSKDAGLSAQTPRHSRARWAACSLCLRAGHLSARGEDVLWPRVLVFVQVRVNTPELSCKQRGWGSMAVRPTSLPLCGDIPRCVSCSHPEGPSRIDPGCLPRSLVTLFLTYLATLSSTLAKPLGLLPKQTFYALFLPQICFWMSSNWDISLSR